jgi:hypothetical protein
MYTREKLQREGEHLSLISHSRSHAESSFFFFFFDQMLEVYRSKRVRQACNTGWKPAKQNIHWPREQAPLSIVKHERRVLWNMLPSTSQAENMDPLYIDPEKQPTTKSMGTRLPQ